MNTRELLEMTVLDSLGLLEPHEQSAFERSFEAAPAAIRDQVRFEQARLADLTDLLPSVEPRAELRDQVLGAVRQAMAEQEAGASVEARSTRHEQGRSVPRLSRGPRVSWVWRAAAIALAVSVAVMGVALTQYQMDFNSLENKVRLGQLEELLGSEHFNDLLYNPQTRRAVLTPVSGESPASASVVFNPDRSAARFFHKNIGTDADSGSFRLVVLDENDNIVREVATFDSQGRQDAFDVELNMLNESRLGLMQVSLDEDERLLLRCDGLTAG